MVKRKLNDKDISSLLGLYNSGLSSWEIAKKFDTYHSNILHHFKRLNVKRRDKSSAAKEGVKSGRIKIKRNKIPKNLKLNNDLAYVLGVLAGDGYMDYNEKKRRYNVGLSATDKEFVEKFKESLFNFFKVNSSDEFRKSRNKNWSDQYITRLCSKEACDFINTIGNFRKDKWGIPDIIKNSTERIKCAFLRGFFDSEGEIDKRIWRIGATSMNMNGLKQVGELLKSLGIRYTIINVKDNRLNTHQKYRLRIHDKKSIKLFNESIGFTIKRKQMILATMFPRDRDRLTP